MHKSRCQKIVEISLSKSVDNPSSAQANANVECSNTNIREIHSFDHSDKSTHLFDGRATTRKICEIRNVDWRNEVKTRSGKEGQENESILRIDSRYVNCANLKVPSYLLSSETLTSDNDKCFLTSVDFNSDFFGLTATGEDQTRALKETFPSNEAFEKKICYPECKPSTSGIVANKSKKPKAPTVPAQTLLDDLEISSSESDPFAGDDEDRDPDFQLPEDSRTKSAIFVGSKKMRNQESDPESTASEEVKKEKSRKRTREPELWKRNKIKRSRNSGKSYVNCKGNLVVERKLKAPCASRLKCSNKITGENRSNIFTGYWGLSDINRQRDYIAKYVICQKKARSRKRNITENQEDIENEECSRRNFSFVYHLPLDEQKVRVCKTFFLDTLSISAQTVRAVFNKLGSSGVVSEDKRGKVCKNSMLDESVKQSIRKHINCFETVESHYCRLKSERLFLPPTLNISKMYQLYEEYCKDNGIPHKATESMYRTVFNTEFNLSFFQPKKNLCDICHRYENGSTDEKISMGDEYQLHSKNKNLARALKAADKERAKQKTTLCCAVFDSQQVLSVPKSDVGLAYYKLKLSTYNFTVFDLASKGAFCYMWYQCIGNRGPLKLAAALFFLLRLTFERVLMNLHSILTTALVKIETNTCSRFTTTSLKSIKLRFVTLSWKKDILSRKATQYTALSKRPLGMYRCTHPSSGILLSGPVNGNNLT
nr:unnamed protein product [Callosobruchus chinensis]